MRLSSCFERSYTDPTAAAVEAVRYLMLGAGATNGYVMLALRRKAQPRKNASDPLGGYRVAVHRRAIPPSPAAMELIRSIIATEDYVESPLNTEVARRAGEIWAARLRDAADPDAVRVYLESPLTVALGTGDAIMATFPLGADGFVVFGLDRERGRPDFTGAECSRVRELLPALAPPLRRLGAHHGLVGGRYRLSPREVEVYQLLLSHRPERQIARALGLTQSRTHELVRAVFRKHGASGRLELWHAWMSSAFGAADAALGGEERERAAR